MSKEEIKNEINKVLDNFSDQSLEELLLFLKGLEARHENSLYDISALQKILAEDRELLKKLAQ
jgi:hypothetical protein